MEPTEYIKNWIMAKFEKYAKQLGIAQNNLPTILFTTREVKTLSDQRQALGGIEERLMGIRNSPRPAGKCWNDASVIFIDIKKHVSLKQTENTIVHELIHSRFPGLGHHTKLTQRLYDNLIRLVLKEGKTDKDILNGGNIIVEHNNKPPKHRENGTLYYNYSYVKVPKIKTMKVYHTIDIQTRLAKYDNTIIPILVAYVISKPDIRFFSNRFKTLTNNLKRIIRHELYNDNEDIDVILNYDKTKDYNAMLRKEIKQ